MTAMGYKRYARVALFGLALSLFAMRGRAEDLDVNGDDVVRLAVVSVAQHSGGVSIPYFCADLEALFKGGRQKKPTRVSFEPVSENRTLMGWWYNPSSLPVRERLFSGQFDGLLLAENDEIVRDYPEFFFEAVRAITCQARKRNMRVSLLLMSKPANSFRDRRVDSIAATVYRVGDGCGVEVIPAAFGWQEALTHNRVTGDSPIKVRACAYLSAEAAYYQLTGDRSSKAALEMYWTNKRTRATLAESAYDAVDHERVKKHYAGPFRGVVRIEPHIKKRLKVYVPNAAANDPLRLNLQFIFDAAFQDGFWKSPSDWYHDGFDRYSTAFDLVFGDSQQIEQYLNPALYTASSEPTHQPQPCVAVFCRVPEGENAQQGVNALRMLEPVLLEGYDYAKSKGLVFVPYPLAWARAYDEHAALVQAAVPGGANDWLTYMLATMLYTAVTDRFQLPPEKRKPFCANDSHPHGYHEICARIGYETFVQLARLRAPVNALLLRSETYRIDAENPGFAGIRLLDRPERDVKVFCAADVPGIVTLSRDTLVFTPENYDIEQTVRLLPVTNSPSHIFRFMASAKSEDTAVDGASDMRPFLINYDDSDNGQLVFATNSLSPAVKFRTVLRPVQRPCDIVCARIVQHGQVTEEVYFGDDAYSGAVVRLCPTASDYKRGFMSVSVQTHSFDQRFNEKKFAFTFQVSHDNQALPEVRLTAPRNGAVIEGPAFVLARAEADLTSGVTGLCVHLGPKRLGCSDTPVCSAPVEQGPPQSRLGEGTYTLWATAATANGVVVASDPVTFRVQEAGAP